MFATYYNANIEPSEDVIMSMIFDPELHPIRRTLDFSALRVSDRTFTGAVIVPEFQTCSDLGLFDPGGSLRWGNVGARLKASRLGAGYLVYVDDGCIATLEGHIYGDEWPAKIELSELYELNTPDSPSRLTGDSGAK